MEQRKLKAKEVLYAFLIVGILLIGYASLEFGNYIIASIALGVVLIVVLHEIYTMPKAEKNKIKEIENKSITFRLFKYIQIILFLILILYVFSYVSSKII